jgi:hypothetical protein
VGELNSSSLKNPTQHNTTFLPQPHLTYTPPNPQTHPIETIKFVKEKAYEIATITKEPLTSHAHHVNMQNIYNTNPNVYSNFAFFCITK